MTDINKTIGANIKALRKSKTKLTQLEVSQLIGCTRDMYSKIEIGYSTLTNDRLIKLCKLYECTPNDIFKGVY